MLSRLIRGILYHRIETGLPAKIRRKLIMVAYPRPAGRWDDAVKGVPTMSIQEVAARRAWFLFEAGRGR
jgi:hypothetical protein